jgi:hypothetical protein
MYLRGNLFGPSTSLYDDCRSALTVGIVIAAYVGFFFALYWLMQPTVNSGLAGYRPPPKTIVKSAYAPWVPPNPSEALPIRAVAEPQEPKKETKKQEARTIPRGAEIVDRRSISSGTTRAS